MSGFWQRIRSVLGGGRGLPDGVAVDLADDEHVVSVAEVVGGGHLVVTQLGLWVPDEGRSRRVGWQWVSKAVWDRSALLLTESVEIPDDGGAGGSGGAVLLRDLPPRRYPLREPGKLPEAVRLRVTGSIRSSSHRDTAGGAAWFVQRKVPGRDGVVLQVRPDPGADLGAVRAAAVDAADRLAQRSGTA